MPKKQRCILTVLHNKAAMILKRRCYLEIPYFNGPKKEILILTKVRAMLLAKENESLTTNK
jgi:hypothetical protein